MHRKILALSIALATWSVPSAAEVLPSNPPWGMCAAQFVRWPDFELRGAGGIAQSTYVEADAGGGATRTGEYSFSGNVHLQRDAQRLSAQRVLYTSTHDEAQAEGDVEISQNDLLLRADAARYSPSAAQGTMEQTRFYLNSRHLRGTAARSQIQSKDGAAFQEAVLTTCDEGNEAWRLHAHHLTLDSAANLGTATHVWIDFMHVPFLYLPYVDFPLAGRKSGFMIPTFGRSSRSGTHVAVPYYWNIAPNMDATLTFQNFTDRGRQVMTEYRYLSEHSRGQINADYLPNDKITETKRSYVVYKHDWTPTQNWVTQLNYRYASDQDYFNDFGDRLSTTNVTQLERNARAVYRGSNWTLRGDLLDYQVLDPLATPQAHPYRKLPQISLRNDTPPDYFGLRPQFIGEFVRFDRQDTMSGSRLDVQPSIALPYEGTAGFIRPKLALRYTVYALTDTVATANKHPTRSVPIFSTDTGLYFEREVLVNDRSWLQTLEPRLYYLRAPYRDQSNLIVDETGASTTFDTGTNALTVTQLFQDNRFSGGDRVGDANQVSTALTTRVIDAHGSERIAATVGRIYYFEDRRVTMPATAIETARRSDYVGELRGVPLKYLTVTANVQWDPVQDTSSAATLQFRYQPRKESIANLAFRLARDPTTGALTQHDVDASLFWPVYSGWNVIGRSNYAVQYRFHKEWFAGLEYDSCCWAFRVLSRSTINNLAVDHWYDNPERSRTVMLQLELKGLSNVGQNIHNLLEQGEHGIAGYK